FHLWGLGGYVHRDMLDVLKDAMPTPTLVDLRWGDSGHAVVVTRIENDRVYFRNPWGEVKDVKDGYNYPDPPRRLEDAKNDIESMPFSDSKAHLKNVFQADGCAGGGKSSLERLPEPPAGERQAWRCTCKRS